MPYESTPQYPVMRLSYIMTKYKSNVALLFLKLCLYGASMENGGSTSFVPLGSSVNTDTVGPFMLWAGTIIPSVIGGGTSYFLANRHFDCTIILHLQHVTF